MKLEVAVTSSEFTIAVAGGNFYREERLLKKMLRVAGSGCGKLVLRVTGYGFFVAGCQLPVPGWVLQPFRGPGQVLLREGP